MIDRREFLAASVLGMTLAVTRSLRAEAKHPLKLLIMGGTGFLGPHIVEAAIKRGHTMTLFNRGKTHPGLFPNLEKLHGDRKNDMKALEGRKWDAVIDTSAYIP